MSILIQQDAYSIGKIANGGYSPIEHLAKTVALSRLLWQEVQFAMFTAAFDASGTVHDQPYLIMAGYLATADQWMTFDRRWLKRLRDDKISYFRRSECASNTKQFNDWDKKPTEKKDKLLRDLIKIINDTTERKTGCIVEHRTKKRRYWKV